MGSTTPTVRYVVVDLPAEEIGDGTCLRSDKPIRVLFGFIVICTMLTMDDGALNWVPHRPPPTHPCLSARVQSDDDDPYAPNGVVIPPKGLL